MGSKVYWNCLIGSMAEQISILHMEVNFQFDGMTPIRSLCTPFAVCTPQKGNAPPEQAVHPLKPFSIKTQYLFQKWIAI